MQSDGRVSGGLAGGRLLRLTTFGALYFAQGLPWGFIAVGYVVFMADQGFDNASVGDALTLAYLPWSFKIVWGLLIDRFPAPRGGRRRPYIIAAELLMGLTMIGLALLPDLGTQLGLVSAILFVHNSFAALQDVATDALAVDVLAPDERGRANGIMYGAKSAGVAAGGGGGVYLAHLTSWPTVMIGMGLTLWAIMLLPILMSEAASPEAAPPRPRPNLRTLFAALRFGPSLMGLALALFTPLGYAIVDSFSTRMYRADLGLSAERIALLSGVIVPVTGALGALLGGYLSDKLGSKLTLAGSMLGIALAIAVFGAAQPHWRDMSFLIAWSIAFTTFQYMFSAAALGLYMTLSDPAVGATHFAVYMASVNLCYAGSAWLGGRLADGLGYVPTFFLAACVQLLTIGLLPLCDVRAAERRFRGT